MTGQGHGSDSGQIRTAAVVIIAAFVLWMAGQAVGGALGLPVKYAFLIDLSCMAAMVWAMIVLLRVWRARQN